MDLDARERCLRVWTPTGQAFGRDVHEVRGRSLPEALGSEAGDALQALARATRHRRVGGRLEYCLEVEGEMRWYSAEATVRAPRPGGARAPALLVRDVTQVRALEERALPAGLFSAAAPRAPAGAEPRGRAALRQPRGPRGVSGPAGARRGAPAGGGGAGLGVARRRGGRALVLVELEGRDWELTVAPLVDPEGLRVFARDVTARKQMEAQLVRADRLSALGSLAAAVGHEMGNPLAYMVANLCFAREELERMAQELGGREPEACGQLGEVVEALAEAAEGADRLKVIVQDVRLLTRSPPSHRAPVEVVPVLENALSLVRGELRHRARLEKDFRPVPSVEADEARLGQVFVNLLLNALQAMGEQDAARNVLRVATYTSERGEAVVEVGDTGVGLAPEVLARLFEPFFSTRLTSTGLGLSVSHAIVTGLGGTLRADSREGGGTTLTVVLPPASASALRGVSAD